MTDFRALFEVVPGAALIVAVMSQVGAAGCPRWARRFLARGVVMGWALLDTFLEPLARKSGTGSGVSGRRPGRGSFFLSLLAWLLPADDRADWIESWQSDLACLPRGWKRFRYVVSQTRGAPALARALRAAARDRGRA